MSNMNLGSIATHCLNSVDNVPTSISGILIEMANQSMLRVQNWTGETIGSLAILERYQPAIIAFCMSDLSMRLQIQNGGIVQSSIEGLSATKNYGTQSDSWEKIGNEHLRRLGKAGGFYKVLE